jgi:hypothetical protein
MKTRVKIGVNVQIVSIKARPFFKLTSVGGRKNNFWEHFQGFFILYSMSERMG